MEAPPERGDSCPGEIICECELVTRPQVEAALLRSRSLVLNDLRRDLRLGMGPCQAGFCACRAAGLLHTLEVDGARLSPDVTQTNSALLEFLQERWKGLRPVMWGANIVGFGAYGYRYANGRELEWPLIAFSPRKQNLTVYLETGFGGAGDLLRALGSHSHTKVCLYLRSLDDIHLPTLKKLVRASVRHTRRSVS